MSNVQIEYRITLSKRKRTKFTEKEKRVLRPIAETLALLDGNAFFGITTDDNGDDTFYENYLPEAWDLFRSNGGFTGWAGELSWIKETKHENDTVKDAYQQWQLLKILSKKQSE